MIGSIQPLCGGFSELILSIILFGSYGIAIPSLAMIAAVAFGAFITYGGCIPSFSLPKLLFFGIWFVMYLVFAMAGWVTWYFHGRTCEAWIAISIWLGTIILMSIWPLAMFVLGNLPILLVSFVFSALGVLAFGIWICIRHFSIVTLILSIIVFVWLLYMIGWSFVLWRYYGKLPKWRRSPRKVYVHFKYLLNTYSDSELDVEDRKVPMQQYNEPPINF